ncbi:outer membrane lipoprotein-sorting protein [bacterium]|nr:outer membrane lipoprotein-sorting protein [bacterium]
MRKNLNLTHKIVGLVTLFSFVFFCSVQAETAQEKGRLLMEQIDVLPKLEKMISETVLDIYDSQGNKLFSKKSRSANYIQDFRDNDKKLSRSISYFYAPADDKGNGALMIENKDEDDDQWIYLKGLRKPKRIIGSDKSSSFMGSDFSNGDVSARDIDDSNYTWLATEKIEFKGKNLTVEKIEGSFKDEQMKNDYGYSKSIVWMHIQSGLPFKMELYNLNGQLYKQAQLLGFAIKKNRDGEKVFIPTALEMKNVIKGTKTIMEVKQIKTGDDAAQIDPSIFKTDYLTRKWW